ncbi:MAG: DMT family transporter, partial [Pseudomonadota bacterium]|nr:DMT family transporter [Pseudomonadota bacterium]
MGKSDLVRLVALAAIWGASFMFIRVLSPVIGPWATAESRVLLGGAVLVAYAGALRRHAELRQFWRVYVVVGAVNSAVPFALFAFAALHLPASYLAILNSSTPLFAALLAAVWLNEPLTRPKVVGITCGCAGVILVSKTGPVVPDVMFAWAVAASLGAAFCYAAAGIYLRRTAAHAPPLAVAGWSQLAAAGLLLPGLLASGRPLPTATLRDPLVIADVVALAVVCSALAYVLYYRLMRDIGPMRTLTVTFLIPLFGMLWGRMFLDETITVSMVLG